MHLALIKTPMGSLVPSTGEDADEIARLRTGTTIHADFKLQRNSKFHRKFFAMLKLGFDHWEPTLPTYEGETVLKNFERFRKDVTILAGYHDMVVNLKGEVRAEAKSISFGNMDETEFQQLYSAVADVLLSRVLRTYTREDLDHVINQMVGFV